MSKSLGNFFTVRELLDEGFDGLVIRYVMLSTHYRKPMDWTKEKAAQAEATLTRWMELTADITPSAPTKLVLDDKFLDALGDDLNTHLALGYLRALHSQPQKLLDHARWLGFLSDDSREKFVRLWSTTSFGSGESELQSNLAAKLDALRKAAVMSKDFSAVDAMKSALNGAGVEVRMSKTGVELVPGPGFDAARLEALK